MELDLIKKKKPLLQEKKTIKEISFFAEKIALTLQEKDFFCLFLIGHMGAGKTTLSQKILYALGLAKETPVHSPTFSIVNEYNIKEKTIAHLDLYRRGGFFSDEEIIETFDPLRYKGILIEWPSEEELSFLKPTHILLISSDQKSLGSRSYSFYEV